MDNDNITIYHISTYNPIGFKDRIVEEPYRFKEIGVRRIKEEVKNPDGSTSDVVREIVDHVPHPEKVWEAGTPINSKNLNHMEAGIANNNLAIISFIRDWASMKNMINALANNTISVDAHNRFVCNFNNLSGVKIEEGYWDPVRGVLICVG